jgi:hypothetical protein
MITSLASITTCTCITPATSQFLKEIISYHSGGLGLLAAPVATAQETPKSMLVEVAIRLHNCTRSLIRRSEAVATKSPHKIPTF